MERVSFASLVFSRLFLVAAVLLGQLSGGGVCCCWIKHCVAQIGTDRDKVQDRNEGKKFVCPQCIAKFKKSKESKQQIQDSRCHCGGQAVIAMSPVSDSDAKVRMDEAFNTLATHGMLSLRCSDIATLEIQCNHHFELSHWQARACIWRI